MIHNRKLLTIRVFTPVSGLRLSQTAQIFFPQSARGFSREPAAALEACRGHCSLSLVLTGDSALLLSIPALSYNSRENTRA